MSTVTEKNDVGQSGTIAPFAGRIAVVTGAASGIGRAVAKYLAIHGALVAGVDRGPGLEEQIGTLSRPAAQGDATKKHLAVIQDLTEPGAAEAVISRVEQEAGAPSILVNSAGVGLIDQAVELKEETWNITLGVNLSASFFMAQAAGQRMLDAGYGRIISIASQAAELGLPQHAAYSASKAGVLGFTRVMAVEWARSGVTVNAVSPTIVATALGRHVWAGDRGEKAREEIPAGRFADPEEVAALVGYLAGEEAAMITGENIVIDGGRSII